MPTHWSSAPSVTASDFGGLETIRKEIVKTVCDSVTTKDDGEEDPLVETVSPVAQQAPPATPVPQAPVVIPTAAPIETAAPTTTEAPTVATPPPEAEAAEEEKDKMEEEEYDECTKAPIEEEKNCRTEWMKCFRAIRNGAQCGRARMTCERANRAIKAAKANGKM
jgi:hypothetical protein